MTGWMKRLAAAVGIAALAAAGFATGAGSAAADAIDDIRERGRLRVGVKADYPPYGYLDGSGRIVGIEPELAQDVADLLGVQLELVPVLSTNRIAFVEEGRVDLLIATLTDTAARRDVVRVVDPNYYASGTNILTKGPFTRWEDLKDAPVCGIQGAFYNRRTAELYDANIVGFKATAEALTALKQSRCVAFVYDDAFIVSRLAEPEWEGWKMPLPTVDPAPWGVAVRKGEDVFAALVSGVVVQWHLTGRILALERKYGVQPTAFAQEMHELFAGINPVIER